MNTAKRVATATFLFFAASFPAIAQTTAVKEAPDPWRGTRFTYGHAATALSFNRAAEPHYNPTWGHRLEVRPQWHFGEQLFLRTRFELAQEFTASDEFNSANEVSWSDVQLDVGARGLEDPFAKVRFGGAVRFTGGISKASLHDSRVASIGPSVLLSRSFPILGGLGLSYEARYTHRFHRYTTRQNAGAHLSACFDPGEPIDCGAWAQDPVRNVRADLSQTLALSFQPISALSLSAQFQLVHQWLYPLPPSEWDAIAFQPRDDTHVRYPWAFGVEAAYDLPVAKGVSVALGASTASMQLGADGVRRSPFFNRYTQLYLNVGLELGNP